MPHLGGEGRFDAFPVTAFEKLKSLSGEGHVKKSASIGAALRICSEYKDKLPRRRKVSKPEAQELVTLCEVSHNRQLMESAAIVLGRSRHLGLSRTLLEKALLRDPIAVNTQMSLLTTLVFSGKFADTLPYIRSLLPVIPEDVTLQRFAVQAGKFAGDMELANAGLALIKKHNPAQAEAASRFLSAPLKRRPKPQPTK